MDFNISITFSAGSTFDFIRESFIVVICGDSAACALQPAEHQA